MGQLGLLCKAVLWKNTPKSGDDAWHL